MKPVEVIIYVVLSVACSGCLPSLMSSDYKIPLSEGYAIIRASRNDIALFHDNASSGICTMVMGPTIDGYHVYKDILVGYTVKPRPEAEDKNTPPGYFVFSFRTGEAITGLSYKQWIDQLNRHGIRTAPLLHRPSAKDGVRGYNKPDK